MAPKAHPHRAGGGLTRTHSRGSSGGGSRLGLNNLQLTAKEPAPARYTDKQKKAHHFEANGRGAAHISRNNSSVRLHQRENATGPPLRRPSGSSTTKSGLKNKAGFSISSPSEEADEEEWVSSESGAATPNNDSDAETGSTPVETHKPRLPPNLALANGFAKDDLPTPRAEISALPLIDTTLQPAKSVQATDGVNGSHVERRDYAPQPLPTPPLTALPNHEDAVTNEPTPLRPSTPPVTKARSETHSPPRRSPTDVKRPMTRPPSVTSIHSSSIHPLRPHPLIRANSLGYGAVLGGPAKPAPLAPLTTVPLQTSVSETMASSPTSMRAGSPTLSMHGGVTSPVLSHPSPTISEASRQLRRSSISSRSSVATMPSGHPMQTSASHAQLSKTTNHDRQRTLSSSSTLAALSSLNLSRRPAQSPTKTALQQMVVYLPSVDQASQTEHIHPLLPPPYINAHLTMLAYRNPLAESYDRVMRAKNAR
ncbi:hypothetical protein BDW22DRAFT_1354904 [Trametopsis cervina]|nr:hypothetical protein BDW22DRAFT_1354904 [Trametopsis cervina]